MSAQAIFWLLVALVFVALLALAAGQALRGLRELERAKARLAGLAELPVVAALSRAQGDAQRLELSLGQIAPLAARARTALAGIRRGPLPPELPAALAQVQAEIAALRRFRAG